MVAFPAFPDNPLASAVYDSHPPDDITTWSTVDLDTLAEWEAARLGLEFTDLPPDWVGEHTQTPTDGFTTIDGGY